MSFEANDDDNNNNTSDHVLFLPLITEELVSLPLPINVVSAYWNVSLPMADAHDAAKRYPGFEGGIIIEGVELAERNNLACVMLHSDMESLRAAIDAGIPPIVILPGIPGNPEITQHASVVSGYGDDGVIYHYVQEGTTQGDQQEGAIPADVFEREWSEEGNLLILLAPSDILAPMPIRMSAQVNVACRLCFDAERAIILGDKSGAADSLKEALQMDPNNVTALQMLGALCNEQNMPECVSYYEKCIQRNSRAYLAYNGLGNYYLKKTEFAKAESYYTQAVEINPKRSARIYKNRAYLREKQNLADGARDDLKLYIKYLPNAPDRGVIEQAIRDLS